MANHLSFLYFGILNHLFYLYFHYYQSALEGGFAGATVLITFGAILGKTNPLQLFFIAIVETTLFCVNSYIGYILLQTVDGGN